MSSRAESYMLNVLLRFEPNVAPHEEIWDALWGDRSDGGPDWADRAIAVYACKLRRRGYNIKTVYGKGYQLCLTRSTTPTPQPTSSCPQRCENSGMPLQSPQPLVPRELASVGIAGVE